MDSATIALVLAMIGVNFGWEPTSDGPAGYEYTVQIEPEILELLRRGEAVPIESTVPEEVAPIRKVKIVVGRGDVARTAMSADAAKLEKYATVDAPTNRSRGKPAAPRDDKLIVRGQSPDNSLSRSTAARGSGGMAPAWTPPRYQQPANPTVDRYGNPQNPSASRVAPPPGFGSRVGGAVDETANALRDGLEAGFAEASEQLSRAGDDIWQSTRGAAQNVTQQLQSAGGNLRDATQQTLDAVGDQVQRRGDQLLGGSGTQPPPFNRNVSGAPSRNQSTSIAAPPWPSTQLQAGNTLVAGGPITRTQSGWTSIGGSIAAPPVRPPGLNAAVAVSTANATPISAASNVAGPSFPMGQTGRGQPLHAPLSDPSAASQIAGQSAAQRSLPETESDNARNDSGLIPIRPVAPRVPEGQQIAGGFDDPWADDPWKQPPQASPINSEAPSSAAPASNLSNNWSQTGANAEEANWSGGPSGAEHANASTDDATDRHAATSAGALPVSAPRYSSTPAPSPAASPTGNTTDTLPAAASAPGSTATPPADVPWKPLLFVSLGLVCSLSANLFLSWSYLDARQRYVGLVRKTAQSFRRRADAA